MTENTDPQTRRPKLATFLINLDGSEERLTSATRQIATNVDYRRFSAFDGRGRNPQDFPEYDDAKAVRFYGRPMTGGEMGCYFSHIGCARAFLDTDADFALVLEDDVLCNQNSFGVLDRMVDWIDRADLTNWDMINLCLPPTKMYSALETFEGEKAIFSLTRAFYPPMTTTAIMWSRQGAERFLATSDHIYAPLDHYFRRWLATSGRGLAVVPPLFGITGAESDLDDEGGGVPARRKMPKTVSYFWSEFRRQSINYVSAAYHYVGQKFSGS